MAIKPLFFALMGYLIFLTMMLRASTSASNNNDDDNGDDVNIIMI